MSFFNKILGGISESDKEIRKRVGAELDKYKKNLEQFQQQQEEQQPQKTFSEPTPPLGEGFVIFKIDENGNIGIQLSWNCGSKDLAHAMGVMLYYLNEGKLEEHCANSLTMTVKQDPKQKEFVQKIGESWKELRGKNEQVVKPSEVFQMGRQSITRPNHAGPKEQK